MPTELSRPDVEEYLRLHAEVATRKERMEQLRELILPALRAGASSPSDLPYALVRKIQNRRSFDYKTPLRRIYYAVLGKRQAEKQIAALEAKFEVNEVEQLCVEINHVYQASSLLDVTDHMSTSTGRKYMRVPLQ